MLVLWELVVRLAGVPAFLLPAPSAIAAQIGAQFAVLLSTAAVTGGNALVGLVAGFLLGVALALLAARSRLVARAGHAGRAGRERGADRRAGPGVHHDVRLDHRDPAPAGGDHRGAGAGVRLDRARAAPGAARCTPS